MSSYASPIIHKLEPLAITKPILQGETLRGYLERLAHENVYLSPNWISRVGTDSVKPFDLEWFETLSHLTQVSPIELLAALKRECGPLWDMRSEIDLTRSEAPKRTRRVRFNGRHLRNASNRCFCPKCLDEAHYERSAWLSKYSLFCLRHECFLVHQCPECSSAVHVSALVADFCLKCGTRLSEAPVTTSDPTNTGSQILLDYWWGSSVEVLALIPNLPEASNIELYRVFIGMVDVSLRTRLHTSMRSRSEAGSSLENSKAATEGNGLAESLAIAYEAMCDWPHSFHTFLDSVRGRHGRTFGEHIRRDFGWLYTNLLESEWQDIPFVQRAFEDFLHRHYRYCHSVERTRRYQENLEFRSRFEYVSHQEAARRLGVHTDDVMRLVGHNAFLHEFPHNVPYGHGDWLHTYTVDYLSKQFLKPKSAASCASYLGVPEDVIHEFVRRGLLLKESNGRREGMIDGRSLMKLKFRYRSAMSPIEGPMVQILDAVEGMGVCNWNLADIVESILNGQLHAMGGGVAITSSFVCGSDLKRLKFKLLESLIEPAAASIAREFGVDPSRVLNWYKLGILSTTSTGGRNIFEMTSDDLNCFRDKYVSYREAAKIVELSESTFADYAEKGRFKEVGLQYTRIRSGLFLREEVERFTRGRTLSPSEIRCRYRISAQQLEKWVQSGTLTSLTGPGVDRCNTNRFAREDIERCLAESVENSQ